MFNQGKLPQKELWKLAEKEIITQKNPFIKFLEDVNESTLKGRKYYAKETDGFLKDF